MFSREFPFVFFVSYAYICTCVRPHLKETVLWGNITWSEVGKQNIQAKEVNTKGSAHLGIMVLCVVCVMVVGAGGGGGGGEGERGWCA